MLCGHAGPWRATARVRRDCGSLGADDRGWPGEHEPVGAGRTAICGGDAADVPARRLSDALLQRRPAVRKTNPVLLDAGARLRHARSHRDRRAAAHGDPHARRAGPDVPDRRAAPQSPCGGHRHADPGNDLPLRDLVTPGPHRRPRPFLDAGCPLLVREIRAIGARPHNGDRPLGPVPEHCSRGRRSDSGR